MTERQLTSAGRVAALAPPIDSSVGDFFVLLKPRVMSLVVFTGFTGIMLAPGNIHPIIAGIAVLCIAAATGASGALNMWYERDLDSKMQRTKDRPLPAGRMQPETALVFGSVVAGGSVIVMGLGVNWSAAFLLTVAIFFYVFVYTIWLKRKTPQNIVIGGAAGAFPPMIGWAAVSGDISVGGIVLFFLIFVWTPPHFWALALYKSKDYESAGIPMLPVVSGKEETKRQVLLYTIVLLPVSMLPWLIGIATTFWAAFAGAMGVIFVILAIRLWFDQTDCTAKRMFRFSMLYLTFLFATLILDSVLVSRFII